MKHLLRSLIPSILTLTLLSFVFPLGGTSQAAPPVAASRLAIRSLAAQQTTWQPHLTSNASVLGGAWTPLGPQSVNTAGCSVSSTCLHYGLNSGIVTALAVNPSNSSDVWLGAADGGVWHSTDGGAHWTPLSDSWPTLSIGSIAIDPHNPNTIYVGTGNAVQDGNDPFPEGGLGVMKTTDGGAHWTQLGFGGVVVTNIGKIAVDPNNSNNVLATQSYSVIGNSSVSASGIWQSTNGGATWTQVLADPPNSGNPVPDLGTDVVFDPAHPGVVFAGLGSSSQTTPSIAGVYKSTNSGATWSLLTNTIPSGASVVRVSLGISHDGQHVYAVLIGGLGLLNSAIYVSTDNGASWTAKDVSGVPGMVSDCCGFDLAAADPSDSTGNTAYAGSGNLWQTRDGGTTWTNLTNAFSGGSVHFNQHALAFLSSSSSSYYLGNDGGVWSGTNAGTFTNLNGGGLNITDLFGGSIGEVGPDAQLYGAGLLGEDQFPTGMPQTGPAQWNEVFGGFNNFANDFGSTVVDYANNANVYAIDNEINISMDGGATWALAPLPGAEPDATLLIISPNNPNELIAGGETQIFLSADGGATWTPISPILNAGDSGFRALAMAPGNDNVIYATDGLHLYVTTNKGGSWTTRTGPFFGLAVDPTNPSVVYAITPDFPSGPPNTHIYKSIDGGISWTAISTSLPNVFYHSVVVNPVNHSMVLASSDAGAFISTNGGACWSTLGTGLPNAAINQVFLNQTGTRIFAATFGRGMWTLPMPQPPILGACPAQIPPTSPHSPGRGCAGPPCTPHVARLTTTDNSPQ